MSDNTSAATATTNTANRSRNGDNDELSTEKSKSSLTLYQPLLQQPQPAVGLQRDNKVLTTEAIDEDNEDDNPSVVGDSDDGTTGHGNGNGDQNDSADEGTDDFEKDELDDRTDDESSTTSSGDGKASEGTHTSTTITANPRQKQQPQALRLHHRGRCAGVFGVVGTLLAHCTSHLCEARPDRSRFLSNWASILAISAAISTVSALYWTNQLHLSDQDPKIGQTKSNKKGSIRVGFLGNSILYYNDCPRLLEHMLQQQYSNVKQDSCLRGGASFISLLKYGNGMEQKFATPAAMRDDGSYDIGSPTVRDLLVDTPVRDGSSWDFVVMNDFTQAPAREETRDETIKVLKEAYLPMIPTDDTTVIFVQTAAYRRDVKNSEEIGDFDEFTSALQKGYAKYAQAIPNSKVAPFGQAYQYIRRNLKKLGYKIAFDDPNSLWYKLYARDDFHPSPHGTLLEASVLYCTITGKQPPTYEISWWKTARYMQPPGGKQLPLPTAEEGRVLQEVASIVCGLEPPQSQSRL